MGEWRARARAFTELRGRRAVSAFVRRLSALLLVVTLACAATPVSAQGSAHAIRDTMRQAAPAIRRCAERALERGEDLGGGHAIEVHVERSGRVRHARFGDARTRAPGFARCATSVLKRLRFPPQPARVVVRYPLNVDAVR